jgi:hypothetical protein
MYELMGLPNGGGWEIKVCKNNKTPPPSAFEKLRINTRICNLSWLDSLQKLFYCHNKLP